MTDVAEFYFHLKPFELTPKELHALGEFTARVAQEAANELFSTELNIEVVFEPGSLLGWVTWKKLGVGAGLLLGSIATYPDLVEGAQLLASHSQQASQFVREQLWHHTPVLPDQVYRTERRTKTPGKICRSLMQLNKSTTNEERAVALNTLKQAIANLPIADQKLAEVCIKERYPEFELRTGYRTLVQSTPHQVDYLRVSTPTAKWKTKFNWSVSSEGRKLLGDVNTTYGGSTQLPVLRDGWKWPED